MSCSHEVDAFKGECQASVGFVQAAIDHPIGKQRGANSSADQRSIAHQDRRQ